MNRIIILILSLSLYPLSSQAQTPTLIIEQMFQAIESVENMEFTFRQIERMSAWTSESLVYSKLNVSPKKLYVRTIEPDKDIELLWVEGKYSGKALVNPNGFPYFNVKLNPRGSTLLAPQHHPVTDSGFSKFYKVFQKAFEQIQENNAFKIDYQGTTQFDGKSCYIITLENPNFSFIDYTVKKGETLFVIAQQRALSEYMMMIHNEEVADYFDVSAGQTIRIPTSYAQKITVYVSADDYLPVFWKMEDPEGLFEQYEFLDLKVNQVFSETEFTEGCKNYGF